MMHVSRYDPDVDSDGGWEIGDAYPVMREEATGSYVKSDDYDALAARLAEAKATLRKIADHAIESPSQAAYWARTFLRATASASTGPQHKCIYCAMGLETVSNSRGEVWHEFDDETRVECTAVTVADGQKP